jgi:hypothetical protein
MASTDNPTTTLVPMGKYKNRPMSDLLADRGYCHWLLTQPWFKREQPALHGLVKRQRRINDLRNDFNSI